jgi:hypothetical protein
MSPTPLYAAAAKGHITMVEWLINPGASTSTLSPTGLLSFLANDPESVSRRRLFFSDYRAEDIQKIKSRINVSHWQ